MTAPFPHGYHVTLSWPGHGGARLEAPGRPAIEGGAPSEFDGRDSWWSPEHLLLASLSLCLTTTFEALSRKAKLAVRDYSCRAEATLDRAQAGLAFTAFALHVRVEVAEADAERTPRLLESAKRHCLVAGALAVPVAFDVVVSTPAVVGVH